MSVTVIAPSGAERPDIFRVTMDSVSSKFLDALVAAEQVQPFRDRKDLKTRISHPRRALYAWHDPNDNDGALISIQAAFTQGLAGNVQNILNAVGSAATNTDTVNFYSISNWRRGGGGHIGKSFIHAVAKAIAEEHPHIVQFATLSPMAGFRDWIMQRSDNLPEPLSKNLVQLAAAYILSGSEKEGKFVALNPVAHFHLGNGAELARICPNADKSEAGLTKSLGFMANYRYPSQEQCERNARAYREGSPARSTEINALLQQEAPVLRRTRFERVEAFRLARRMTEGMPIDTLKLVKKAAGILRERQQNPRQFIASHPDFPAGLLNVPRRELHIS